MIHYMKTKKIGKTTHLALKLDINKAYDWVEWPYLKAVLLKMGFHPRWVTLIIGCVSSVSYSVLINGDPNGYIIPSRGLR
jgi:hypothetical protein